MSPEPGEEVSFFDPWRQERRAGTVIAMRRAVNNPWQVAVVRLPDGTNTEVHPDRLESLLAEGGISV